MGSRSRRDVISAGLLAFSGAMAGCSFLVGGESSPDEIPLYGTNGGDGFVSLQYWVYATDPVPENDRLDGVARLRPGEEKQLEEIPVDIPETQFDITANIVERDTQRNVLLDVDCDSDALSTNGYRISVLSGSRDDVGKPGQPVTHDSTPGNEGVTADFIRIGPR